MEKICVYTCITGEYDNLNEIKNAEKHLDYYCFTNNKNLKSKTWKIIQIENEGLDNCRLARKIKTIGHPIIDKYDIAVWTDADIIWQKPISNFIEQYLKDAPLAIFKHHARNNIYEEAIACLTLRKDNKETIIKTLDFLKSNHYPDKNGLCESTVFIKRIKNPVVIETMQTWFDVIKNYSRRDQLSFNYAIWKTGLKPKYIKLNVWDNAWFNTVKHIPNQTIENCHIYYGDPAQNFDFNKYSILNYKEKGSSYEIATTIPNDTNQIELNLTDVIGSTYENLTVKPTPSSIELRDFANYSSKNVFCTGRSIINLYGNYKKGQKLILSVDLKKPDSATTSKLIESLWIKNASLSNANANLQNQNRSLQEANKNLQTNIQNIFNSKSWKTIQAIQKLIPTIKK